MEIFAISGLGADNRVFNHLKIRGKLVSVDWILPEKNEELKNYAKRLILRNGITKKSCIIGVSFGGLIAVEISKILKPKLTILISSAETKKDLRFLYRLIGKINLLKIIPKGMLNPPRQVANKIFGATNKTLLNEILNDTDLDFAKWSIEKLTTWKNIDKLENCLKICGDKDKLMPLRKDEYTKVIKRGQHFMIVDKAEEISEIINNEIIAKQKML